MFNFEHFLPLVAGALNLPAPLTMPLHSLLVINEGTWTETDADKACIGGIVGQLQGVDLRSDSFHLKPGIRSDSQHPIRVASPSCYMPIKRNGAAH